MQLKVDGKIKIDFLIPYIGVGINYLEFYIENILKTSSNLVNIDFLVSYHNKEDFEILKKSKIFKYIKKTVHAKKDERKIFYSTSVSHTNALNELYKNISGEITIFSDYDMAFVQKSWDQYIISELYKNNIDLMGVNYHSQPLNIQEYIGSEQPIYCFKYQMIPNLSFLVAKSSILKKYFPQKISIYDELSYENGFTPFKQINTNYESKIYNLEMHYGVWLDTGFEIPDVVYKNKLKTKLILHNQNLADNFFSKIESSILTKQEIFLLDNKPFLAHYRKGTQKKDDGAFSLFKDDINNYIFKNN
jgi:hypothetical protein